MHQIKKNNNILLIVNKQTLHKKKTRYLDFAETINAGQLNLQSSYRAKCIIITEK